jgi:hypothetical protein
LVSENPLLKRVTRGALLSEPRHGLKHEVILLLQAQSCGQDYPYLSNQADLSSLKSSDGIVKPVTVRVIYDNYARVDSLTADWGYSIVIEGLEKTILFDTGTKPEIFASNFRKIGIDASEIDFLVLSLNG